MSMARMEEQIIFVDFFILTSSYTLSMFFSPNRPVGRNSRIIINRINVNASLKVEYPKATRKVSQIPMTKPPTTAPGILPIPPRTAATKHFNPGRVPENGVTDIRSVKYRMEPIAARKLPIIKVLLIVLFRRTPISWAVSKSFETARMAIPVFVWLIRNISPITSRMVNTGVIKVTREADTDPIWNIFFRKGISGYARGRAVNR